MCCLRMYVLLECNVQFCRLHAFVAQQFIYLGLIIIHDEKIIVHAFFFASPCNNTVAQW